MQTQTISFSVRFIEAKDNETVAQIIRQVMTEFDCVGEAYSIEDPEISDMFTAYNNDESFFKVLEYNGAVVGCGGIAPLKDGPKGTCELKKMYFLPKARGKGQGKKFLQQCLEEAKALGYEKCYLETVERMAAANHLYKKVGFEKLCGTMGNTGHCGCDTYYVKTL